MRIIFEYMIADIPSALPSNLCNLSLQTTSGLQMHSWLCLKL